MQGSGRRRQNHYYIPYILSKYTTEDQRKKIVVWRKRKERNTICNYISFCSSLLLSFHRLDRMETFSAADVTRWKDEYGRSIAKMFIGGLQPPGFTHSLASYNSIIKHFKIEEIKNKSCLEIGVGQGFLAYILWKAGASKVVGIDLGAETPKKRVAGGVMSTSKDWAVFDIFLYIPRTAFEDLGPHRVEFEYIDFATLDLDGEWFRNHNFNVVTQLIGNFQLVEKLVLYFCQNKSSSLHSIVFMIPTEGLGYLENVIETWSLSQQHEIKRETITLSGSREQRKLMILKMSPLSPCMSSLVSSTSTHNRDVDNGSSNSDNSSRSKKKRKAEMKLEKKNEKKTKVVVNVTDPLTVDNEGRVPIWWPSTTGVIVNYKVGNGAMQAAHSALGLREGSINWVALDNERKSRLERIAKQRGECEQGSHFGDINVGDIFNTWSRMGSPYSVTNQNLLLTELMQRTYGIYIARFSVGQREYRYIVIDCFNRLVVDNKQGKTFSLDSETNATTAKGRAKYLQKTLEVLDLEKVWLVKVKRGNVPIKKA